MKKRYLITCFIAIAIQINAQDYQVTFALLSEAGAPDSVMIENQTQGSNITISGTDVLHLVKTITGISNIPGIVDALNIYPNPNDGQFTIEMLSDPSDEPTRVRIFNLAGKIIFNDLLNPTETKKEYSLQEEAPGAYILMVSNGKNIVSAKKFIKR